MTKGLVTVFGGSGFVGKHVVRALVRDGWRVRVPCRRPHTAQDLKVIGNVGQVQLMQANVRFPSSVAKAVEGADAVINLVAVLYEDGKQNFESLHIEGAATVAQAAKNAGITNFVQMSALGADSDSKSDYARTKAAGEQAVREHLPRADIMRPSIIFGEEDDFFNRFAAMSQFAPALPLLGGGATKFQPVYVGDVADAIAKVIGAGTSGESYELGGPRVYSFKELLSFTLAAVGRKRFLAPVPWFGANILGLMGELSSLVPFVPPFLTRDQVSALKTDNVVTDGAKGFEELGIDTQTIEAVVPEYLERYRKYGQFHETSA